VVTEVISDVLLWSKESYFIDRLSDKAVYHKGENMANSCHHPGCERDTLVHPRATSVLYSFLDAHAMATVEWS
jgi:hypothetical protein